MTRAWELEITGRLLSLNDRLHWRRKHQLSKALRDETHVRALAARIPAMGHVHVRLELTPTTSRRRDADNLIATLKPCIDGLRDAGVVPDDTPDHVTFDQPVILPPAHDRRVALVVTEVG